MVYNWLSIVQEWLYPTSCVLCSAPGNAKLDLCLQCNRELPWLGNACTSCALPLPHGDTTVCGACIRTPSPYTHAISLFHYQHPVSDMLRDLKFHGKLQYAQLLGRLLAIRLMDADIELPDCIVPVPLHKRRLRQRGFNQSLELARPIARTLNLPLERNLCPRILDTAAQTGLDKHQRRANLRHAFEAQSTPLGHVAIIDDVVTTGETARAFARCLKRSGVEKIQLWCVARA